jgi:hypothetical protein
MRLYGNAHLGIYLQVTEGGELRVGDKLVRAD